MLENRPWICFHCEFETTIRTEAAAHFGNEGEDPLCLKWNELEDSDKARARQEIIQELNEEREENRRLRVENEGLEYRVDSNESAIASRFKGCRTIDQAWQEFDSMEGRALSAEQRAEKMAAAMEPFRHYTFDQFGFYQEIVEGGSLLLGRTGLLERDIRRALQALDDYSGVPSPMEKRARAAESRVRELEEILHKSSNDAYEIFEYSIDGL